MSAPVPGVSLENIPALAPPQGIRPNFINPASREHEIIIVEGIFVPLMLLVVSMRLFVRARITKRWGWDDYTCVIAACGSVVHMIDFTQMFRVGFGRHLWDIKAITLLDAHNSRLLASNGIVYRFTIFFAKLSIMLLYLRIFKIDTLLRFFIYFGIVFQALFYSAMIGVSIGSFVKCNDPAQIINQFCVNYGKPVVVLNAAVNVITDSYVLLLPISRVMKLQLSRGHRIGVLLVFATGIVTCAASLTRLIIFCVHYSDPDILWIQGRNSAFTIVEINIAIMVACASCFPAFFKKVVVFGDSVFSFIRSHVVTTSRSSGTPGRSVTRQDFGVVKKASADSTRWYGDTERLVGSTKIELHNASHFGRVTTVGAENTSISVGTEQECVVHDQPENSKAVGYGAESHLRV